MMRYLAIPTASAYHVKTGWGGDGGGSKHSQLEVSLIMTLDVLPSACHCSARKELSPGFTSATVRCD